MSLYHVSPFLAFCLSDEMETAVLMEIKQTYSVKITIRISSLAIHYIHIMHQYTRSLSSSIAGIIGSGKSHIFDRERKSPRSLLHGSCHVSSCCSLQLVFKWKCSTVVLEQRD